MFCYNCFTEYEGNYCPSCGYNPADDEGRYPLALKPGSILNGRYIVGRVLGQGGFGITYAAQDYDSKEKIAIKEYFPGDVVTRANSIAVTQISPNSMDSFEYGKECFLNEAKTLAEFQNNKGIVTVYKYFEENGTAYLAMEYVEGASLQKYITDNGGKLSVKEADRIMLQVMDSLQAVHKMGVIHRDIAPDNIIISDSGDTKLIDFGAARYSMGEKSQSLDVILKHGFAPFEQYARHGRQGPYTDIYALAATYYYAVTGKTPPDAIDRIDNDTIESPKKLGENREAALMKALAVKAENRYQSVEEFKNAFFLKGNTEKTIKIRQEKHYDQIPQNGLEYQKKQIKNERDNKLLKALAAVLTALVMVFLITSFSHKDKSKEEIIKEDSSQPVEDYSGNTGLQTPFLTQAPTIVPTLEPAESYIQSYNIGDYIEFGAYEQDNNRQNGKEKINWRVLDVQDGRLLVISEYVLDCKRFYSDRVPITWENSDLRKWLNNDFIYEAFNETERSKIKEVVLENYDSADTSDKLFVLSENEARTYFTSDNDRRCKATKYATSNGVYTPPTSSHCWFWLRSPGANPWDAEIVREAGDIYLEGDGVYRSYNGVRPAMWIVAG